MSILLRKPFIFMILAAGLLSAAAGARAEGELVAGIDGLPLMPGLTINAEEIMIFDAPSGRIVEASASGEVASQQVIDFYASTLPQLGWLRNSEMVFSREEEVLKLELSGLGSLLNVRFALSPATTTPH